MTNPNETGRFLKLTRGVVRQSIFAWIAAFTSLAGVAPSNAAECILPDNIDWVVNASCEVSGIRIAPQNMSITNGATLTVKSSGEIILDMRNFAVNVAPGSRLIVEPGGRVRSNQIGPLLVRQSDGGMFGYFLKRVGGPVLDTINPDLSFHPSSAIKVLYMIEALRQVDNGVLNLGTTNLALCPVTPAITPGPGQTCPNSFINPPAPQTIAGGAGGNCNHGAAPATPLVPNNPATCGNPLQAIGLGVGICAMMKVSNNASANAIQETVGGGNPQTGWNNMLNNAGASIGLTSTIFGNRMGCLGPFENPISQTTLRDLGLLYEQMVTTPAVLFPSAPPVPFVFQNTNAYLFMDNDQNELNVNNFVGAIVTEQAAEAGIDATTTVNFRNNIRLVHKTGSNTANTLAGCNIGPRCVPAGCTGAANNQQCPDPTQPLFRTAAGWLSLPINGGADTRDYVYGLFVNNVTASSVIANGTTPIADPAMPQVSIIDNSMLDEAGELLRSVIRDALENF